MNDLCGFFAGTLVLICVVALFAATVFGIGFAFALGSEYALQFMYRG